MDDLEISDIQPVAEWLESDGKHVFQRKAQWDHFLRKFGDELVASGALIRQRGRGGNLVVARILNKQVPKLLREQAMAEIGLADSARVGNQRVVAA